MYASTNEFIPVPDIVEQRRLWPLLASDKFSAKAVREERITDDERAKYFAKVAGNTTGTTTKATKEQSMVVAMHYYLFLMRLDLEGARSSS